MSSYDTYKAYLKSNKWKVLKSKRLAMDGECVLCGGDPDAIHHRRYPDELGTETVDDLVTLCTSCHGMFHSGKKPVYRNDCGVSDADFAAWFMHRLPKLYRIITLSWGLCDPITELVDKDTGEKNLMVIQTLEDSLKESSDEIL